METEEDLKREREGRTSKGDLWFSKVAAGRCSSANSAAHEKLILSYIRPKLTWASSSSGYSCFQAYITC